MTATQELLTNHFVGLQLVDTITFFKVGNVEALQFDTGKESTAIFSAVASGSNSDFQNIDELEPDDKPVNHLFQVRMGCFYNMEYAVKIPTGTSRFGIDTAKDIGFFDAELSPHLAPSKLSEFWLIKNFFPQVKATNNSATTLIPKLRWVGWKYEIYPVDNETQDKLKRGQLPYKHISIGGLRR